MPDLFAPKVQGLGKPTGTKGKILFGAKKFGVGALRTAGDILAAPQRATMFAMTGTYQDPSEALGLKGWQGLMADVVLDPINFLTFGASTAAKGIQIGGKTLTRAGVKTLDDLTQVAVKEVTASLTAKGFRKLPNFNTQMIRSSMDDLTEVASKFADFRPVKGPVVDIMEAGRKKAVRSFTRALDGQADNLVTTSGMERRFLLPNMIDRGGIKIGLPFTEGKTIVDSAQVKRFTDPIKSVINKIPGLEQFGQRASKTFFTSHDLDEAVKAGRISEKAAKGFRNGLDNMVHQYRAVQNDSLDLYKGISKTIKQLKREGQIDDALYRKLGEQVERNAIKLDDWYKVSDELGDAARTMSERIDESDFLYKKMNLQTLKGRGTKLVATKETKEFIEQEGKNVGLGSREFKLQDSPHRQYFKFMNAAGEAKVGRLDVLGFKQLDNTDITQIAKRNKVPARTLKDLKSSFAAKSTLKDLKRGTLNLTEADRLLWKKGIATSFEINEQYAKAGSKLFYEDFELTRAIDEIETWDKFRNFDIANWMRKNKYGIKASKAPGNWVEPKLFADMVKKGHWSEAYKMPKEMADTMDRHFEAFFNDDNMNAVMKAFNGFNSWWKSWTLGVFPAYHARNEIDDSFRAIFAGGAKASNWLTNRKRAITMLRNVAKGKGMGDEVIKGLTNADAYRSMRKLGVIESSGVYFDEIENGIRSAQDLSKAAIFKQYATISKDNALVQKGFEIGQFMENSRRASLWFDGIQRGMSHDEAAWLVKKVMFDYGDLTAIERKVIKPLLPFYTFTRKSLELNLRELSHHPRFYSTAYKLGKKDVENPELLFEGEIPFFVPFSMAKLFGKTKKGSKYYVDLNSYISMYSDPQKVMKPTDTFIGLLNPAIKSFFEWKADFDFWKGRPNYPGEMEELFGQPVRKSGVFYNSAKNIRLLTTIDRLFFRKKSIAGEEITAPQRIVRDLIGLKLREFDPKQRKEYLKGKQKRAEQEEKARERNIKKIKSKY